jgi:NAD(P)-dependent dehydrogenase (short-subunit alcohol dehydrogenase family)
MGSANKSRVRELFDLSGRVAIVTGGAGLLGYHHGAILADAGANVVLLDLAVANPGMRAEQLQTAHGPECLGLAADITSESSLLEAHDAILAKFGRIDILIITPPTIPRSKPIRRVSRSSGRGWKISRWRCGTRISRSG